MFGAEVWKFWLNCKSTMCAKMECLFNFKMKFGFYWTTVLHLASQKTYGIEQSQI